MLTVKQLEKKILQEEMMTVHVEVVKSIKNVRGKYMASVLGSQKNVSMTGINPPIDVFNISNIHESKS